MKDKVYVTVVKPSGDIVYSVHFSKIVKGDTWTDPHNGNVLVAQSDFDGNGVIVKETH